jgi:hypothetical protein
MGSAGIASTHHKRFSGVADFRQSIEHCVDASSSQTRAILSQHKQRFGFPHKAQHLEPETRPLASKSSSSARCADVLTWEPSGNKSNSPKRLAVCGPDVIVDTDSFAKVLP